MIAGGNVAALNTIKGIGAKTAQRIIVDLKDRILKVSGMEGTVQSALLNPVKDEAVSALVMLGFNAVASAKAVDQILKKEPDLRVEQLIKIALKMM